ncbi:MAG: DUF507 family protein [Polyangiaceae bacterium]|nr:DUF507 family protein [Polyangiaceae bacterium]
MRIHGARVPHLAAQMVAQLTSSGAVECESPPEVQADLEAVLNQYIRDEKEITETAKDFLAARNLPPSELPRLRKLAAEQRKVRIGDEAIDYLLDQLVEILMHSANVDEVFAEDFELRRLLREPLRREQVEEDKLQAEVRGQLRHVREGTTLWEVEYRRMMEDVRRRKGL